MRKILSAAIATVMILSNVFVCSAETGTSISLTSRYTGNIFFDQDFAQFAVVVDNHGADITMHYQLYMLDETGMRQETSIFDTQESYTDESTIRDRIEIPLSRYGLYELDAVVMEDGTEVAKTTVSLSKATESKTQNPRLGINVHLTRYGISDMLLPLVKKAGFGGIRDTFGWNHYEKIQGVRQLDDRTIRLFQEAKENNLDVLATLFTEANVYDEKISYNGELNYSEYLRTEDAPNYQEFLTWFLTQPMVYETVTKLEVMNEPDIATRVQDEYLEVVWGDKNGADATHSKRAVAYQTMVDTVRTSVTAAEAQLAGKSYEVAIPSVCSVHDISAKVFVDRVLEAVEKDSFDTLSMHPYMAGNRPEDPESGSNGSYSTDVGLIERIAYYRDLVNGAQTGAATGNTYSYEKTEPFWQTEYGYASAGLETEVTVAGSEHAQGILDVRATDRIMTKTNDIAYLYQMTENPSQASSQNSFGLLHAYTDKNPYAAKAAFLAMANYNSLVADAKTASEVYGNSYKYVSKYEVPDKNRNVYMLWTSSADSKNLNYDLSQDSYYGTGVHYYDCYGNEISEAEILTQNGYTVTQEPFYAVVGEEIDRTPSNEEWLVISGNTNAGISGERISLTVTDSTGDIGTGFSPSGTVYLSQSVTGKDGAFCFEIKAPDSETAVAYIVTEHDEQLVLRFTLQSDTELAVYSDGMDATDLSFSQLKLSNISVKAKFEAGSEIDEYQIIAALYEGDGNVLKEVKLFDRTRQSNTVESELIDVGFTQSGDMMKVMMWDGALKPLCKVVVKK